MIDQEKIIKALDCCLDIVRSGRWASGCITCPYAVEENSCREKMILDVIALLKDQETSDTGKARIFQCEKCGYGFNDIFLIDEHNYDIEPHYCPNCGRSVKRDA